MTLQLVLMIVAVVLLALASFGVNPGSSKIHVGWLGLTFWAIAVLVSIA